MTRRILLGMVWLACLTVVPLVRAADTRGPEQPEAKAVELFAAMDGGKLQVQLIPKDARQATVIIKNVTAKPLRIQLPAAFAGMPVLAQDDFGALGGGLGDSGNNQNQALGGGMGMGGMGMGGMGMGGGFFNVAPDRVGKLKVAAVCLEHGKDDPNPRKPYQLRPITDFTSDPQVIEVCKMIGRGEIDQAAAQAAVWHLTDGLSWQALARKVKIRHLDGRVELYFSPTQLQRALRVVHVAHQRAQAESSAAQTSAAPSLSGS
jgi:hypothetical protein